ncbi:cytochrome P450 734A1-like [Chenopodium quinoa]|uniref:cytochrome P450 734A1-like n=1 Tax=Chenopodium quinoa TaxID=63459 RepID=UPI000B76F793|nr:cytochrome P450 734A1-like [Chenopodium quinoa]
MDDDGFLVKLLGIKPIIFTSIMFVLVLRIMVVLWWRPRKLEYHFAKQGIKGPPYNFFIGNVKEIVQLMLKASSHPMPFSHNILPRVFSFYHHWRKIYGTTFIVWFGPTARLTVSDPDLIREIFSTKSEFYEKIEANPLVKQLEGDGLISLKGEKWAHHRKIITPTFHMENLKLLIPMVGKSVEEMLDKWDRMMCEKGEVEIEVSEWFQGLTEDVITRMAFGSSYEQGKAIFRLQSHQMLLAADAFQKVLIPGYRFLPTKGNVKSWRLDKEIRRSLVKLIEKRKLENQNLNNNNNDDYNIIMGNNNIGSEEVAENGGPKDLLGLMIQAGMRENEKNNSIPEFPINNSSLLSSLNYAPQLSSTNYNNNNINNNKITVQDIVEECKSFFFAGKQTTSNLLTWTTVLLAMHPHWQDLAREEVLRVCPSRDLPSKDDLAKLKMLSMILNESLRLYPPAIATIRRAKYDVELGGCRVPRGTELLVPILAVHHDQAIWGNDANEFNPMRFADGVSRAAKHPVAFIPFGLGTRTCIGQNLAILQAKLVLTILLQRFSFTLAPSYQHAPTVLMLLYPQHGAPIVFRRLSEDNRDDREVSC